MDFQWCGPHVVPGDTIKANGETIRVESVGPLNPPDPREPAWAAVTVVRGTNERDRYAIAHLTDVDVVYRATRAPVGAR